MALNTDDAYRCIFLSPITRFSLGVAAGQVWHCGFLAPRTASFSLVNRIVSCSPIKTSLHGHGALFSFHPCYRLDPQMRYIPHLTRVAARTFYDAIQARCRRLTAVAV
jgi:hypothetical protein